MSRELSGEARAGRLRGSRERTLVQAYPAGGAGGLGSGMTDRGTWKKDFPPKTLKSGLLSYIREMIQDQHTSLNRVGLHQLRCSESISLPSCSPACSPRVVWGAGGEAGGSLLGGSKRPWEPPECTSPAFLPCLPRAASLGNFPLGEGVSRRGGLSQMPHPQASETLMSISLLAQGTCTV